MSNTDLNIVKMSLSSSLIIYFAFVVLSIFGYAINLTLSYSHSHSYALNLSLSLTLAVRVASVTVNVALPIDSNCRCSSSSSTRQPPIHTCLHTRRQTHTCTCINRDILEAIRSSHSFRLPFSSVARFALTSAIILIISQF